MLLFWVKSEYDENGIYETYYKNSDKLLEQKREYDAEWFN